ncbi:MAG: hypothetical protein Q8936_14920 [Bacillota bacterium]|nr:hypothetical protein [Bacillota bacterium]
MKKYIAIFKQSLILTAIFAVIKLIFVLFSSKFILSKFISDISMYFVLIFIGGAIFVTFINKNYFDQYK